MKKNDVMELEVEALGSEGEGIAHVDGYTLFIKDSLPGDRIEARITKLLKNYGYARCEKIIKASKDRMEADCPLSKRCGGCQLSHLSYEAELRFKERKVFDCLTRIGGFSKEEVKLLPILDSEATRHYRNKAQFPVGVNKAGEIVTGFYAGRSHEIVETMDCGIQAEENRLILSTIVEFMKEKGITAYREVEHRGLVRHIVTRKGFATGEISVCIVVNGDSLPKSELLVKRLVERVKGIESISLNVHKKKTNVILGDDLVCLYGRDYIFDKIGELSFKISPFSFYQVNPFQTKKLYDLALDFAGLTGKEIVWDLYCGIGTISLFLAKRAKEVFGVEIVPEAIVNAKENAALNGITNASFFVGKAEEEAEKLPRPDVIVVDPPRKGCDGKLLATIIKHRPERLVYVSCDPATLSRDLKILCTEGGYQLEKVQPVDQFPRSVHCESVALLTRL